MITEKELEKIMNPEEAKDYIELTKTVLSNMIKDFEENKAIREKYAKESKEPFSLGKPKRHYRLDLHLKGNEALAVIQLLESIDKLKDIKEQM